MKAFDTHILARFFIDDSEDLQAAIQRPAASTALSGRGLVAVTVLLEFEWVMRGFYQLPRAEILAVLRTLASIEHIVVQDRTAVLAALDAFDAGLDFADALHLSRSTRASGFATFDQRLFKRAQGLALIPPIELLVRAQAHCAGAGQCSIRKQPAPRRLRRCHAQMPVGRQRGDAPARRAL